MDKKKIMIVDDDKDFLDELKDLLNASGYDTYGVSESALVPGTATALKPDLILLDLRMPKVTGFEIAAELKFLADTAKIPIIAMTGYYTVEDRSFLMNFCSIQKCLKKPLSTVNVIKEIELALSEKSTT